MIQVTDGVVAQCPECMWIVDDMGRFAHKANGLIHGARHLVCPRCVRKASEETTE